MMVVNKHSSKPKLRLLKVFGAVYHHKTRCRCKLKMQTAEVTQLNNKLKPKTKIRKEGRHLRAKCRPKHKILEVVLKRSSRCRLNSRQQTAESRSKVRHRLSLNQGKAALVNKCKTKRKVRWALAAYLCKIKLKLKLRVDQAEARVSKCKTRLKAKLAKVTRSRHSLKPRLRNNRVFQHNRCKCRTKPHKQQVDKRPKIKRKLRQRIKPAQTVSKCRPKARMLMNGLTRENATTIEKFTFLT